MAETRRETAASQAVEGYVSELTRQALRRLPEEEARRAVAEVVGHLAERVAELEAAGGTRAEAEALALAGFGPARVLARDLADSAYADRWTPAWRVLGGAVTGVLLAVPVVSQALRAADPIAAAAEWSRSELARALAVPQNGGVPLTPTLLAATLACALLARRASPGRTLAIGAAGAAAMFAVAGMTMVQSARGPLDAYTASRAAMDHHSTASHLDWEMQLSGRGVAFYREAPNTAEVPVVLRGPGDTYVVPLPPSEVSPFSVFRPLPDVHRRRMTAELSDKAGGPVNPWDYLYRVPPRTVTGREEARRLRLAHGPAANNTASARYLEAHRLEPAYDDASARSALSFDSAAGVGAGAWFVQVTVLMLGADAAGAAAGRLLWRARRRGRGARA